MVLSAGYIQAILYSIKAFHLWERIVILFVGTFAKSRYTFTKVGVAQTSTKFVLDSERPTTLDQKGSQSS